MRIFKTKVFAKDARSEGLTDDALKEAINEIQKGLIDARLGSNLIKKRIAVKDKGKSGGLRIILVIKAPASKVFCVYVFSKRDVDNITAQQLHQLRALAKCLLAMTEEDIKRALGVAELQEVEIEDEEEK